MKKLLLFFFLLSFTACTINESNVPGPQGPPGNANVISTGPIELKSWFYNTQFRWFAADIAIPEITPDVANTGLVMVYQQISSGTNPVWIPLPDTYGNVTTNFDLYAGGVTIYRFNVDNTVPVAPPALVVRVVIIPDAFRIANPDTNWQNYEATKEILKLQE